MAKVKASEPVKYSVLKRALEDAAKEEGIKIRERTEIKRLANLADHEAQYLLFEIKLGGLGRRLYGFRVKVTSLTEPQDDPSLKGFEIDYRLAGRKISERYVQSVEKRTSVEFSIERRVPAV